MKSAVLVWFRNMGTLVGIPVGHAHE